MNDGIPEAVRGKRLTGNVGLRQWGSRFAYAPSQKRPSARPTRDTV